MNGVIIAGMEMPSDCFDCERRKKCCGNSCSIQNRKIDCPLKSVKGLIEYIKEHSYPVRYDRNSVENGMTITGIEQAIKEYCEVTE